MKTKYTLLHALFMPLSLLMAGIAYMLLQWFHPTINLDAATAPYPWQAWVVTLAVLCVPVVHYVCSAESRKDPWYAQALWVTLGLVMMALVHRTRLMLDVQVPFFIAAIVYCIATRGKQLHWPPMMFILLPIMFIYYAISISWSVDKSYGVVLLNRMVPLATFPIVFSLFRVDEQHGQRMLLILWRVVWLACLLCFLSAAYHARLLDISIWDFFTLRKSMIHYKYYLFNLLFAWSGSAHPSYNIIWLIAGLIASVYLVDKGRIHPIEWLTSAAAIFAVSVMAQSRIGIVLFGLTVMMGIGYWLRAYRRQLAIGLVAASLIGLVVYLRVPYFHEVFLTDDVRSVLLSSTIQCIQAEHWYGCGLGGMTIEHMSELLGRPFPFDFPHVYPHNQLLGDWLQGGVIGLLLYIVLMVSGYVHSIRQRNFLLLCWIVVMTLHMMIEMPLHFLNGTAAFAIVGSLFCAIPYTKQDTNACD